MNIKYVGSHDAVEIAATGQVVERGASVDVADDVAKGLLKQADNWKSVTATKKKGA